MIFAEEQMYKSMEQEIKFRNKHTITCLTNFEKVQSDQEERAVISTN